MNGNSRIEVKESQVAKHLRTADSLVTKAEWKPRHVTAAPGEMHRARLLASTQPSPSMSLIESLKSVRKDGSDILGGVEHRVLHGVRRGIQIALAISDEYRRVTGVDQIGNVANLSNEKRTELQEKMRTASAVVLHSLARFVEEGLAEFSDEGSHREHVVLPECIFDDPISAVRCVVFYLCANVADPRVSNDKALGSTVGVFFEKVIGEVETRKATFKYLEQFQAMSFGIEGIDFTVEGLERHETGVASVEFNRVEHGDVVGNADAKHFIERLASRIACYNFKASKNSFQELGGLMPVWMGYGKPGTGKSMLIGRLATQISDLCKARGVPFLFHPLPDNLIDSYQGNSARNMVKWMVPMQAKDTLVYGSIDDGENVLEERTRQGVSEGARAVIGVFLRYTEGAYAINRGNATIGIMTNLPEQIDAAVRSRVQGRMIIDGAKTVEDALDQSHLWWAKKYGSQKGFVDLKDPDWYTYQSAQKELKSAAEAAQTKDAPEHAIMREIFDRVTKDHSVNTHEFFARLFVAVEERYPLFSSRDKRNIYSAVDLRVMDFDVPDLWFEKMGVFHDQPYERQLDMVKELRTGNMKGLKFSDIVRQEWVRYLDNYARIADAQFDREVDERIKQYRIQAEVTRRLRESGHANNA